MNMNEKNIDKDVEVQHIEERAVVITSLSTPNTVDEVAEVAEGRLRWKIDLFVIPTVAMLYFLCFIDRVNIGQVTPL